MKRDPIINSAASSSGKTSNASAGRIKSVSGGSANYSSPSLKGIPAPNNPYKGR